MATIEEVIGSSLRRVEDCFGIDARSILDLATACRLFPWMAWLLEQVLSISIDNAAKYSGEGSPVDSWHELLLKELKSQSGQRPGLQETERERVPLHKVLSGRASSW